MPYLEYRESDGYVVAIHEEKPEVVEGGYAVARSDRFEPGDEFEYWIKVYADEVKAGRVTSHAAVRQAPPAQEVLKKLRELERRLDMLESYVKNEEKER